MLNYIKKHEDNRIEICHDNNREILDMTMQKYLNSILMKQLSNLRALEVTTKKILNIKGKPPLRLEKDALMLCIRSYKQQASLYLNFFAISKFKKENNKIQITFRSHHMMVITEVYSFQSQMQRCRKLIDYLQNEKVFTYL